jgi:hypothetical protein
MFALAYRQPGASAKVAANLPFSIIVVDKSELVG